MTTLTCILDTCPRDGQYVNHLKCRCCGHNLLGDRQPDGAGSQECQHPNAKHAPDYERWQAMRTMAGVLHLVRR